MHVNTAPPGRALLLAVSLALAIAACVNRTEINTARRSVYDADFAHVYNAAVQTVRAQYPRFVEDPAVGKISTEWQIVNFTNQADDPRSRSGGMAGGLGGTTGGTGTSPLGATDAMGTKRFYVRFDVSVSSQRPYRVRVLGHAAEWRAGDAKASPLRGASVPSWLPAREDALVVGIYRALKSVAQPAPVELAPPPPSEEPAATADEFAGVPAGAAAALAALKTAVVRRDYPAIERVLATDVVWSAGAAPGRAGAMVILRADPARLERLSAALAATCAGDDQQVSCGAAGGPRLTVRPVGATWLVSAFE